MKKLLAIIVVMALTATASATRFGLGGGSYLYPYQFEEEKAIVLSFYTTRDYCLRDEVIVKFKLADGKILRLSGKKTTTKHTEMYVNHSNVTNSPSQIWEIYQVVLPITNQQIEMFSVTTVEKVVINTLPKVFVSKMENKEFTPKLYKELKELKDELSE
jgi:hypothetical protein